MMAAQNDVMIQPCFLHRSISETKTCKKSKVLLVDDYAIHFNLMTVFLKKCGVTEVITAANGKEALDKFFNNDFDLVILDIGLPDMSGFEICMRMRNFLQENKLPIVAYTVDEWHEEACQKAGFDEFWVKPMRFEEIKVRVQRLLEPSIITSAS